MCAHHFWPSAFSAGDPRAILHIVRRIHRLEAGNSGDARSVGGPVVELRVDYGPGYRVYFTRLGALCGGDKRTQDCDIKKALAIAQTLED